MADGLIFSVSHLFLIVKSLPERIIGLIKEFHSKGPDFLIRSFKISRFFVPSHVGLSGNCRSIQAILGKKQYL